MEEFLSHKASSSVSLIHSIDEESKYKVGGLMVDGNTLSYPDDNNKVGVYVAGKPLTSDCSYFEVEIIDPGLQCNMCIGLTSRSCCLDADIGFEEDSVGLSTKNGSITIGGTVIFKLDTNWKSGDKIGCGIKFFNYDEPIETLFYTIVPVYFTYKGKEIGDILVRFPFGGLYPAVSMNSPCEEVNISFGHNWSSEEDCIMSVDSYEEDWYRLNDIRMNGQVLEYTGRGKSIIDVGLAQARVPLNTTTHYFEIEIVDPGENCYIAIGLTKRDYPRHRHPGWNRGSIGYHADDGKVFVGSGVGEPFGPRCHKGDRMGCGILFPRDYVYEYDSDGQSFESSPLSPNDVDDLLELTLDDSDDDDDDDDDDIDNEWWRDQCGGHLDIGCKVKVFFTRNGRIIGFKQVCMPKGGFYPTIGMLSVNEKVRVDLRPLSG